MTRWLAGAVAIGVGMALSSACASSATQSTNTGTPTVTLNPASGQTSGTPTWSTTAACPAGFQGSAIFRAVEPNQSTFSISPATNTVNAPFRGTLLDPLDIIQAYGNFPNSSTTELIVICFSQPSLIGNRRVAMATFITWSSDGKTYTTSATR